MGSSGSKNKPNSEGITKRNIKKIKRIDPDKEEFRPKKEKEKKEERNTKKLREINENDEFDTNQPEYHEYMFFPMKNGEDAKNNNLDLLLKNKNNKKQKQLYTFTKEDDRKKDNDLAQMLHIEYDLDKPKYTYSIKKLKCDPPPVDNDYLVIEYKMNKLIIDPKEKKEDVEEEDVDEEKGENGKYLKEGYVLTSRVVHTNNKNCKISNYVYTQHNGERYDYLDMNKDPNEVRKLKIKKLENEEKRINEKEENEDRFVNKQKKARFTCKKMF